MTEPFRMLPLVLLATFGAWLWFVAASDVVQAADSVPAIAKEAPKENPPQPTEPEPVPLVSLAAELDAAMTSMRSALANDDEAQRELDGLQQAWPLLNRDVALRARENGRILAQLPSLDLLRQLDGRWRDVQTKLGEFAARVEHLLRTLEQRLERMGGDETRWAATLPDAREQGAPPELLARIETLLRELRDGRRELETSRSRALKLQASIADLRMRVDAALEVNGRARDAMLGRMLTRDGAALWQPRRHAEGPESIVIGAGEALEAQAILLRSYATDRLPRFVGHAALLALLSALFYWARRGLRSLVEKEAALARAAAVVEHPIATALVLSLMLTHWIYPDPPRALLAINGIAIFVPTILVLRRLVPAPLIAPLYAVLVFYFLDQARSMSASVDLLPRLLFVAR